MIKHTPGPWSLKYDNVVDNYYIGGDFPSQVATLSTPCGRGTSREERQANAQLIATAPELLEAAKGALILLLQEGLSFDSRVEKLEEIIAEAEDNILHKLNEEQSGKKLNQCRQC